MKLRSAPLDDVWNELQFVVDDDGRRPARIVRTLFTWAYRALKAAMLAMLQLNWQRQPEPYFPELGCEPFNLGETELELEWKQR